MSTDVPIQPECPAGLEIEFEMTVEDLLAFNIYHNAHSPTIQKTYLRMLISYLLMVLALCVMIALDPSKSILFGTMILLIVGLGFLFGSRSYRTWRVKRLVTKMLREGDNRSLVGQQKIVINQESVAKTSACDVIRTNWSGVDRIVVADDYAFIYLSALSAHVIPKRAFAGDADFNQFVQQARHFHGQAGAKPAQA